MEHATPPLTVQQLYQVLGDAMARGLGGQAVEIPYDPGFATLGGQPAVKVQGVHLGFDWDQGRVFLTPEKRLGVPDVQLRKRLRSVEEMVGRMHLATQARGQDDTQRLEVLREQLRTLGGVLAGRDTEPKAG